ncbi:MAG: hypothetical protein EXR11_01460 [Rhodospirillaceae bacterium]|nr:hypothetical protein [Rhodospirillaceae bacterium]
MGIRGSGQQRIDSKKTFVSHIEPGVAARLNRGLSMSRVRIALGLVTLGLIFGPQGATAQDSGTIAEIQASIAQKGMASVIVEMDMARHEGALGIERSTAAGVTDTPESLTAKIERNRAAVANAARAMRTELSQANITMELEYENLPMFVTTVDAAKLERLMAIKNVKAIYLNKALARRQFNSSLLLLEKVAIPISSASDKNETVAADAATERATRSAATTAAAGDTPEKALLSSSVTYINANKAWDRGFKGKDQSIAILDDGIDRNHDMFVGKIVAEACYSTKVNSDDQPLCPGGTTSSTSVGAASNCSAGPEVCSHGSHVAGIAAGNDIIGQITLRGVAFEANLIPIQVFTIVKNQVDCKNETPCMLAYSSATLSALNFAISQAVPQKLAAVSISLGGDPVSGACDTDVRKTAIDSLRNIGVLTVIAAGNDGNLNKITPPACVSSALAVSSIIITVPDREANQATNVALLAPGVLINSANRGNEYVKRSGTSMAAPHAAGAIAILKSAKPAASAGEIENALKTGGIPTTLPEWTWNTPRIDLNKSLDLLGAPGTVFGVAVPGVFGSKNPTGTSFLRFFDIDSSAGTMTVQIYDDTTGVKVGTWTKQIRGFSSPQFTMATIEQESVPPISPAASNSQFYTLFVDAPYVGFVQHVLWNPQTGLLSNVSGCDNGLSGQGRYAGNVHTSLIGGYTSFLLVHNTGNTDARPSFDVRDSRDGAQIGAFATSGNIKAHTSALVKVSDVLQTLGKQPDSGQFHLNLIMNTIGFSGFIQHWVQNDAQGIVTSITAKCDI